jgi:hypothetical protein
LTDTCRMTFQALVTVRNLSERIARTRHSKNRAISDWNLVR